MNIFEFEAKLISGESKPLKDFEGQLLLIVNTASACGFTPQYQPLQKLYEDYQDKGLSILGFPCNQFGGQEPGTSNEIATFCETSYAVKFPMFEKVEVNGDGAHPLYKFLKEAKPGILGSTAIKWNFTKFLVDRNGVPLKRYAPKDPISKIEKDIQALLS